MHSSLGDVYRLRQDSIATGRSSTNEGEALAQPNLGAPFALYSERQSQRSSRHRSTVCNGVLANREVVGMQYVLYSHVEEFCFFVTDELAKKLS